MDTPRTLTSSKEQIDKIKDSLTGTEKEAKPKRFGLSEHENPMLELKTDLYM